MHSPQLTPNDWPISAVAIRLTRAHLGLYLELGRFLKRQHGTSLHLYVSSELEARGIQRDYDSACWDSVNVDDVMWRAIRKPVPDYDLVVHRAREFEKRTGESQQRVMMCYRHLNRGYSPGSFSHPRAREFVGCDYATALHVTNEALAYWDNEIRDKRLDLIIDAGKAAAVMARANGVAYRWYRNARIGNLRQWVHDEYGRSPFIQSAYDRLESFPPAQLTEGYSAAVKKEAMVRAGQRLSAQIRDIIWGLLIAEYRRIFAGGSATPYSWIDIVALPFRSRRQNREFRRLAKTTLSDLKGREFVYFPLQKEPEIALIQAEPETTNQQAVAMAISRELRAGVLLAIKDHSINVGRRGPKYHQQLADLPNAVLLDPDTPSLEAIKKAVATVTIGGTAAIEAGVLGRPAIVFGRRHPASMMSHVFATQTDEDLRDALQAILDGRVDVGKARLDGARFQAALTAASFHVPDVTSSRGVADFEPAVKAVYSGLKRTFESFETVKPQIAPAAS
jgi:hypothetical protein